MKRVGLTSFETLSSSDQGWTLLTGGSSDLDLTPENMNTSFVRGFFALQENELAHMNTDTYVLSIPDMFLSQENFLFKSKFAPHGIEVHRVQECLVSYPFSYRMPKNSLFLEPLNRKIVQLLESGHVKKQLDVVLTGRIINRMNGYTSGLGVERSKPAVDDAPRPFSMVDLQLAFISLGFGHLVAFLAFSAELLINYNETGVRRFLTQCKRSTISLIPACVVRSWRK